jgi:acetate---CoA ligase (ADP-forming)
MRPARTPAARANLRRLFAPASVAVVGASASPEKAGYQALLALEGFSGDVFPINPKAREVLGRQAFPSIKAVGRPLDLVLFAVPAAACVEAAREASACACGGGLIVSGGFAESGAVGRSIQDDLAALCAQSEFRLLGPNTAGFVNKELSLTASFVAGADRIPRGGVAVVAQSAGVNLTVSFLLASAGHGVSIAVGLGNSVDIDAEEMLEFLADDPGTKAIALHLEGVAHGRRLYETLREVTPKKPVVALTVGQEDVGEFAQSHTGNLIGSYALRRNALRQAGAVLVESTQELADTVAALSLARLPPTRNPGIGIVTAQAGPGLLMLDRLKSQGMSVPTLSAATQARVAERLPPMTYQKNPVDTGRPSAAFGDVLAAVADDAQIDVVIAYALHEPAALPAAEVLPAAAKRISKPILFGTTGSPDEIAESLGALRAQGVYVAASPEQLAQVAVGLARDAAMRSRRAPAVSPSKAPQGEELPSRCDEHAAKRLLEAMDVRTPRGVACDSHEEARDALQRLAKPVVAKILAAEILHKTEVGGVHANIADEAALERALAKLDAIPLVSKRRYLIEEMAPEGLDLIVGAVRDPSFGPTVTIGLGGTLAEALRDSATRLAPIELGEAEAMLNELRAARLFDGFRGGPPLDRKAVLESIVALGDFLCRNASVVAFEINPLRVYARGALALDALLIRDSSPTPHFLSQS